MLPARSRRGRYCGTQGGGAAGLEGAWEQRLGIYAPFLLSQEQLNQVLVGTTEFHSTLQELLKWVGHMEEGLGSLPAASYILATVTSQIQEQKVRLAVQGSDTLAPHPHHNLHSSPAQGHSNPRHSAPSQALLVVVTDKELSYIALAFWA